MGMAVEVFEMRLRSEFLGASRMLKNILLFCDWLAMLCSLLASGCGTSLRPTLIDAAQRKPSNIAVYFAVSDSNGEPVADLLASDFNIYEDAKIVSRDESR